MDAELRIRYTPEPFDMHGEVSAVVESGAFKGEGAAFFNTSELRDVFLPAVRAYPLSVDKPPLLVGEPYKTSVDRPLNALFSLSITRWRNAGGLLVRVELQDSLGDSTQPIYQSLSARFWTEYAELERFAIQFENALSDASAIAVLVGRTDGFI